MNNIMTYIQFSPLYPLKGRIAANKSLSRLANITPLRGQGGDHTRQQIITIT